MAEPTQTEERPIEGTFTERPDGTVVPERGIAVRPPSPQELANWSPAFEKAAVDRAIVQVEEKRRFFREVMKPGQHYAIIPGQRPTPRIDQATGEVVKGKDGKSETDPPKPALLKPGAELLLSTMRLRPVLSDAYPPVLDLSGEGHGGEPFVQYRRSCTIYIQTGPATEERIVIAAAEGECNSWEAKYRYRGSGRTCPKCKVVGSIIKGRPQYAPTVDGRRGSPVMPGFEQGGYVCWDKKGGCKAVFADNDDEITTQSEEKVKNEDHASLVNTILKMADKRALVAATLIATGCSDIFTQDVEENAAEVAAAAAPPAQKPTGTPVSDADKKLIRDAYRFFEDARTSKAAKADTKKMADGVIEKFKALMKARKWDTWAALYAAGGDEATLAEVFTIFGIERPKPPDEAPATPPSEEAQRFDPDEVPA